MVSYFGFFIMLVGAVVIFIDGDYKIPFKQQQPSAQEIQDQEAAADRQFTQQLAELRRALVDGDTRLGSELDKIPNDLKLLTERVAAIENKPLPEPLVLPAAPRPEYTAKHPLPVSIVTPVEFFKRPAPKPVTPKVQAAVSRIVGPMQPVRKKK